jgi:PucR C-terminal helix-turn-helix domain/GGDEF-like domain
MSWSPERLPPETSAAVRGGVGTLVDDVIATVRSENPVYADVLGGPEGLGIRMGIEQAIKAFLDAIELGRRPSAATAELWRRLGEAEFQAGRGLESLRAAFRTGTRAAWRGAAELATEAGIDASTVIALAEAIFVYSDELAADVVEGYLRIQSDQAGERERRRRRLATLLVDPAAHDPEAIAHAAELARWTLPRRLAVLVLSGDRPEEVARRLDLDALVGADPGGAYLVLPDPDGPGRQDAVDRAVDGMAAALGPTVATAEAPRSLHWARLALELVQRGALPTDGPTRVGEHLSTVILLQRSDIAGALVEERLAPLEALPDAERERLLQTLAAWLAHQRHTPRIAAELHVHPQTVRYRMGKLRELLGESLETADGRFELELALRARRALRAA